jgi:hypothetical protein
MPQSWREHGGEEKIPWSHSWNWTGSPNTNPFTALSCLAEYKSSLILLNPKLQDSATKFY